MARLFNASTDKVQKASVGNSSTNNYTMFCLFKPLSTGNGGFLMFNGRGNSANGYGILLSASYQLTCDFAFVANYASGLRAAPNKWSAVVLLRRSGTSMMFLNGRKSAVTSSSAPSAVSDYYTLGGVAGAGGAVGSNFEGGLAHCALWARAITDQEAFGLTKRIILPHRIPQSLSQYHPLYGNDPTEKPFMYGSDMNVTGTLAYPEPPPLRTSFRQSFQIAKAGIAVPVGAPKNYGLNNLANLNALTLNHLPRR